MAMITVNVHEAKNNLSHYMALAEKGERVILCRRNVPVIELKPLKDAVPFKPKRFLGPAPGQPAMSKETLDALLEPLDEETLKWFYGEAQGQDDPLFWSGDDAGKKP